jgi:hypothetical protein
MTQTTEQLFPLGKLVMTPGALECMVKYAVDPVQLIKRHARGDWGDLDEEDKKENDFSVTRDLRILSAYKVGNDEKLWVITEADRSSTTILLPDEY